MAKKVTIALCGWITGISTAEKEVLFHPMKKLVRDNWV